MYGALLESLTFLRLDLFFFSSLHLFGFSIHAGLPWVPGHLGHGEEEEGDAGEEEEDKASAGTGEGPGVVILDPDGVLTLYHALDRLTHHLY